MKPLDSGGLRYSSTGISPNRCDSLHPQILAPLFSISTTNHRREASSPDGEACLLFLTPPAWESGVWDAKPAFLLSTNYIIVRSNLLAPLCSLHFRTSGGLCFFECCSSPCLGVSKNHSWERLGGGMSSAQRGQRRLKIVRRQSRIIRGP